VGLADDARPELDALARAEAERARRLPGDRAERQPVHVVYGGAHLFKAATFARLGGLARDALDAHAPDREALDRALGAVLPVEVHDRVRAKLAQEPIEDYRIDFEDGFGTRTDAEEDAEAARTARELRVASPGPPFVGIRIKPLAGETTRRAIRTLEIFLGELGPPPAGFVVTLPKVVLPEQPRALVRLLELLEARHPVASPTPIEIMIESPDALRVLRPLLDACGGRCRGVHFGTYDYTAACGIVAAHQRMDHPAALHALEVIRSAYAGTGVFLSDGATTVMPVGDAAAVRAAWREMYASVGRSLRNGFYQGWDLHPAQLPIRYAATYTFFLEGLAGATERLRTFVERAAQATRVGAIFDDAATGLGLLEWFARGIAAGALTDEDLAATGVSHEELRARSFAAIAKARAR
jgi:hypothetical protein